MLFNDGLCRYHGIVFAGGMISTTWFTERIIFALGRISSRSHVTAAAPLSLRFGIFVFGRHVNQKKQECDISPADAILVDQLTAVCPPYLCLSVFAPTDHKFIAPDSFLYLEIQFNLVYPGSLYKCCHTYIKNHSALLPSPLRYVAP